MGTTLGAAVAASLADGAVRHSLPTPDASAPAAVPLCQNRTSRVVSRSVRINATGWIHPPIQNRAMIWSRKLSNAVSWHNLPASGRYRMTCHMSVTGVTHPVDALGTSQG